MDIFDRVCETTTATGTSGLALDGALTGYQAFGDTGGNLWFFYLIEAVDADGVASGDWEVGIGHMLSTTLQRDAVTSSSNSSSLVDFAAGTKRVHLTAPAAQIGFLGAQVVNSADLTAQDFTTATSLGWDTNSFDTLDDATGGALSFHDVVTNNSRITIPSVMVPMVRLTGQVALTNITADSWVELKIRLSGTDIVARSTHETGSTTPCYQIQSVVAEPSNDDYFELMIQIETDNSVTVVAAESYFQIEVLQ